MNEKLLEPQNRLDKISPGKVNETNLKRMKASGQLIFRMNM